MSIKERLDDIEKKLDLILGIICDKQTAAQKSVETKVRNTLTEDQINRIDMLVEHYSESPEPVEFTATQIAERCDIGTDIASLRAISAYLRNLKGISEARRAEGRMLKIKNPATWTG